MKRMIILALVLVFTAGLIFAAGDKAASEPTKAAKKWDSMTEEEKARSGAAKKAVYE